MIITSEFLKEKGACSEGFKWVSEQKLIGLEAIPFIKKLISADKLRWANWLIVRVMDYKQYVSYAVFAAEQVIEIFEKKYPDDKRPRLAIEAAKKCIDGPSKKNKNAAANAANAAYAAVNAAYAANAATDTVADAAAYAAVNAAYAANAAANAANSAYAAVNAATMGIKILDYGIGLLKEVECLK